MTHARKIDAPRLPCIESCTVKPDLGLALEFSARKGVREMRSGEVAYVYAPCQTLGGRSVNGFKRFRILLQRWIIHLARFSPQHAGHTGFVIDFATSLTTAQGNIPIAFDNFRVNAGTVVSPQ